MDQDAALPPGDPLQGAAVAGRWSFAYDMPEDLGGGFVSGELLLRTDGVLLRRYGGSSYRAGQLTWQFKPWEPVTWWSGETGPQRAVAILKGRGDDLLRARSRAYRPAQVRPPFLGGPRPTSTCNPVETGHANSITQARPQAASLGLIILE